MLANSQIPSLEYLHNMESAEYCLKYLAGSARRGIKFGGYEEDESSGPGRNHLFGWVDADFAADLDTRRSHTGYIIMLNGGPVSCGAAPGKLINEKLEINQRMSVF